MKRIILSSVCLIAMIVAGGFSAAQAQVRYRQYPVDTILVTPDGAILDYVPDRSVVVSRDGMGRRIYIDHYGNLLATEIRQDVRRPDPIDRYPPAPGGYRDYRDYRADNRADDRYDPYAEPGAVTGSIPGAVDRQPLDDGRLPGFEDHYPREASIEPGLQNGTQPGFGALSPHDQQPVIAVTRKSQAEVAALQVFLDRQGISPGVIDGRLGGNVNKAIAAWQEMTGETLDPNNSEDILQRLSYSGGLPVIDYTITPSDAAGPFVASIPNDYAHKAQLPALSYTSVTEKLAEQFHMDEDYLKALNPGVDFTIPGTIIRVVNPGTRKSGKVTRIIADKGREQVFAYGEDGQLVAAYPATIGSSDTPSPAGNHTVTRIALDPGYTYNPKINFKQGNNDRILQIPPGPNGPVGTVWIALSKPTYGIHGTPEPSKIGKTNSHGCVRLTNWDATELAKMVSPGTSVEFVE